jgi:ornithine cyclodeaminase/alanine dehydrogenase
MEGYWLTRVRTASLSAVAAKYLARPDAAVAAFIGCGAQAHAHLDALLQMFPLREIRLLGRGQTNRDILCEKARELGLAAYDCGTAQEAVESADIIISTTPTTTAPVRHIDAAWLKPGAFASLVDLARPWIADSLRQFDGIVIDDLEQEAEMPVQMLDTALVRGDIQDLVTGRISGRGDDGERHAFIFRGLALADLALASLAYQAAVETGVGVYLER